MRSFYLSHLWVLTILWYDKTRFLCVYHSVYIFLYCSHFQLIWMAYFSLIMFLQKDFCFLYIYQGKTGNIYKSPTTSTSYQGMFESVQHPLSLIIFTLRLFLTCTKWRKDRVVNLVEVHSVYSVRKNHI